MRQASARKEEFRPVINNFKSHLSVSIFELLQNNDASTFYPAFNFLSLPLCRMFGVMMMLFSYCLAEYQPLRGHNHEFPRLKSRGQEIAGSPSEEEAVQLFGPRLGEVDILT